MAGISTWVSKAGGAAAGCSPPAPVRTTSAETDSALGWRTLPDCARADSAGFAAGDCTAVAAAAAGGVETAAAAGAAAPPGAATAAGCALAIRAASAAIIRAASAAIFCSSTAEGGSHTSRHMRSSTVLRATAIGASAATGSSRTMLSSASTYTRLTVANVRLRQS